MKPSEYRKQRVSSVELPGGMTVKFRKPNLNRVLLNYDLRPGTIEKISRIGKAVLNDPEKAEIALARDLDEDVKALLCALAADACIEPRCVLLESELQGEDDDRFWLLELDDQDQYELVTAIAGTVGVTQGDLANIAPFRDAGHDVGTEPGDGNTSDDLNEGLAAVATGSEVSG